MNDDFQIRIQSGKPIQKIEIGKLVKENDPVLRQKCNDWIFDDPEKMPMPAIKMASILIETGKAYGALGIAAPQIGYPYRVFAIGYDKQWQICFNPIYTINNLVNPLLEGNEGCLSFPGLSLPIKRSQDISTKFQMPNGEWRQEQYVGITARAFQHEYDHLEGILFTDHVGEMRLIMARNKRKKLLQKIERKSKQGVKK